MNLQRFYQIINQQSVEYRAAELEDLRKIRQEYPYFQLAAMMTLKAIHQNKEADYKSDLAQVASIVYSREVLFNYLYPEYSNNLVVKPVKYKEDNKNKISKPIVAKVKQSLKVVEKPQKPESLKAENGEPIKTKAELMAEVNKRLKEIEYNKSKGQKPETIVSHKQEDKQEVDLINPAKAKLSKTTPRAETAKEIEPIDRGSALSIIESFIKKSPKINSPEDKDYQAEADLAKHSVEESYDIVSETMAELYLKQGYKAKAIKIYKKLILIYPEKSTYFAARISKLKD